MRRRLPYWPQIEEVRWYRQLETDYNDMRAALSWCLSPSGDAVLACAWPFHWQASGNIAAGCGARRAWLGEGRDLMEAALSNASMRRTS